MRSVFVALPLAAGCLGHRAISGSVVDRNGEAVDKVVVSMEPGGVEMVTDTEGKFLVDYIRDDAGERKKLKRKTTYTFELFKPGYHVQENEVAYRKSEMLLEPWTLQEDTIKLDASPDDIDPAKFKDRTHSAGTNYEGE